MSDETLRHFTRRYLEAQSNRVDEIDFAFQGGEPTPLGIDFFHKALTYQEKYCPPGKRIQNAFQTNGLLLDDERDDRTAEAATPAGENHGSDTCRRRVPKPTTAEFPENRAEHALPLRFRKKIQELLPTQEIV